MLRVYWHIDNLSVFSDCFDVTKAYCHGPWSKSSDVYLQQIPHKKLRSRVSTLTEITDPESGMLLIQDLPSKNVCFVVDSQILKFTSCIMLKPHALIRHYHKPFRDKNLLEFLMASRNHFNLTCGKLYELITCNKCKKITLSNKSWSGCK